MIVAAALLRSGGDSLKRCGTVPGIVSLNFVKATIGLFLRVRRSFDSSPRPLALTNSVVVLLRLSKTCSYRDAIQ
jgi:hypothetical protein